MRNRLTVTPRQYRRVAYVTLAALSLIVLSGAAVRLTGSGLGCPDWPKCYGHALPPLSTHALIEFSNRAISGLVGVLTVLAAVLAFTRRPFRRDLAALSVLLPLGVVAQAVLGGFTVREHLAPGIRDEPLRALDAHPHRRRGAGLAGHRRAGLRAAVHRSGRGLVGARAASARGSDHLCGHGRDRRRTARRRLTRSAYPSSHLRGKDTLEWVVHQHATIAALFGVAVIAVWYLLRRRGASETVTEPVTVLGVLLAAQGLVGSVQYELRLPSDMVWVHVTLATVTWLVVLWAVAAVGQSVPRAPAVSALDRPPAAREFGADRQGRVVVAPRAPEQVPSRGADASLSILVVDDESDLREMLTRSFSREGHRVLAVADGRAAIDRASTDHFDIVLLDVALGAGPDGYEVCRTLRGRRNVVPIIMLTALDSEADAVLGLEAGADDYVTKPFGLAELRSRIRAVLRRAGTRAMGDEVLVVGPISLDRAQREVTIEGAPVKLTFSEFELLDALMADPGRLLNRQELLRAIWGDSAYRDPRAIDVHIRHLREKLEPEPEKPRYILTVRGAGYRLRGP